MSLLLDALRRLDAATIARPASATPARREAAPTPPQAARVESPAGEPIAQPNAIEHARGVGAVGLKGSIDSSIDGPIPVPDDGTVGRHSEAPIDETPAYASEARPGLAMAGDAVTGVATIGDARTGAPAAGFDPTPPSSTPQRAAEPPTWEAAYYADRQPIGPSPLREPRTAEVRSAVEPRDEFATPPSAIVERPPAADSVAVELPRSPQAFDCRALAAAIRRLRPAGGRLALVTIGDDPGATGAPPWSADLADELSAIAALPVERLGAGGLAVDGMMSDIRSGYRLYFAGAEFATARGALLRGLDAVLLVVHEGATSVKAAEVVRGALAAQQVEFAGLVYVAR